MACGNIIQGVALNAHGDYIGGFFALLRPFPLLCGLLGLTHMLTQGASWIALKAPLGSDLRANACGLRRIFVMVELALFLLASVLFFAAILPNLSYAPSTGGMIIAGAFAFIFLVDMAVVFICAKPEEPKGDLLAIIFASIGAASLVIIMFATIFPNLVPALDAANSITIAVAQGSPATLGAMTIIACIGVPLVLLYHFLVYRAFRGRVD